MHTKINQTMKHIKSDIETLCAIVCIYYNIDKKELFSHCRIRDKVLKRQIFHYLACKYTKLTYTNIGEYHSHVSGWKIQHSTVMHSERIIQNDMMFDKTIANEVEKLEDMIKSNFIKISLNFPQLKLEIINMIINSQNQFDLKQKLKNYVI